MSGKGVGSVQVEGSKAGMPMAFRSFLTTGTAAPNIDELIRNRPYVYFGDDNLFPQRVREIADNCVPLATCIERNALFIAGKGFLFTTDGKPNEQAQAKYDEWMLDNNEASFRAATANDIAMLNAFSWDVRRNKGNEGIARLDHKDVSRVRAGKKYNGIVPAYLYSSNWQIATSYGNRALPQKYKHHTPRDITAYNPDSKDAIQTLYHKEYKQDKEYYSEPWFLSAIPDAIVWTKVAPFNKSQIDTGFAPNMHVHIPLAKDDKRLEQAIEGFNKSYMGSQGRGITYTWGEGEPPTLTPLDAKFRSGELNAVRLDSTNVIIDACMIPRALSGIETNEGLTGQGEALREKVEYYQRTLVEPKQRVITSNIERLMAHEGIEVDVSIDPLNPFEMFGSDALRLRTQTLNEIREAEGLGPIIGKDGKELDKGYDVAGRIEQSQNNENI